MTKIEPDIDSVKGELRECLARIVQAIERAGGGPWALACIEAERVAVATRIATARGLPPIRSTDASRGRA